MKAHTNEFKETIKTFGRELDSKISYTIDGSEYELGNEDLNSVTPHYQSAILKSTMRELDLEVKENTNLFNINGEVTSSVALEKYNNGFTLTKGTNRFVRINLPKTYEAGTYTLNFDKINSNLNVSWHFGVNIQYNSNTIINIYPFDDKTFTSPSEFNQLYFFINSSEPDTATITIDNIMLNKGDFPQPFERYNKLIDGDAKGTILNYKFGVKTRSGKNVFDYTKSTFSIPNNVLIETSNEIITITTLREATSNNLFFMTKIDDTLLENGQTYTISSENVSGVNNSLKLQLRNKEIVVPQINLEMIV